MTTEAQIKDTVTTNDVVLFMKGTKSMPQCGFSSRVAGVLNFMGVEFADVNVLADEEIRQGIKDYSDWPTVPQLYVKGEFVGGCDIITEMMLSGELDTLFSENSVNFDKDAADKNPRSKRLMTIIGLPIWIPIIVGLLLAVRGFQIWQTNKGTPN